MATIDQWIEGVRPRTLPAAVVPVAAGTAAAVADGQWVWWRALLALVVALALQIGCNLANDYSDGIRGTDTKRIGPARLVASGAGRPGTVLAAAIGCFAAAAIAGLVLAAATSWWLLAVGAAAICAAWFYTGGSRPYGYRALGELAVFVFFGVVATVGTDYVQTERLGWLAPVVSVPVGLLACALLIVNNLRDIDSDAEAGKRTLGVLLGDARTRVLYVICALAPFAIVFWIATDRPWALLTLLALPAALHPIRYVRRGETGAKLITALGATGRLQLAFGLLLTVGLTL